MNGDDSSSSLKTSPPTIFSYEESTSQHPNRNPQTFISRQSLYEDNLWILDHEFPARRSVDVTLNFGKIKLLDGSRLTDEANSALLEIAKDFAYTLLNDPPPSRPQWCTIVSVIERRGFLWLIRFMAFNRIYHLSDLSQEDFEEFLRWVISVPITQKSGVNTEARRAHLLSNETLRNRTKGLDWLYVQRTKMRDGILSDPWANQSITAWTTSNAEQKISREDSRTPEMPDEVASSIVRAALKEITDSATYLSACNDLRQWRSKTLRKAFDWNRYGYENYGELKRHRSDIVAAGYILISMLTGMRVHEVLSIPQGVTASWSEVEIEVDGIRSKCFFVNAHTSKLVPSPLPSQWQTVPIIRNVITIISQLNDLSASGARPFLFSSTRLNFSGKNTASAASSFNSAIKRFCERKKISWNGAIYRPSTHQFRKKFARLLIRQGLGIKELQNQFKHYDINMTRLYGDPNLYAELHQEKFILSNEIYAELLTQQRPIIGGGAAEFRNIQSQFLGMTRADQEQFLEGLPGQALIDQMDDGLCLYNAKRAMCGGEKVNCKPAQCLNSVIPADGLHRSLLLRKRENERLLGFYNGSTLKEGHLQEQISAINILLCQIEEIKSPSYQHDGDNE